MLTDEQIAKIEEETRFASTGAKKNIPLLIADIRTLQQQNKQLVEAVLNAEVYLKLDEDIPDDKDLAYELGYKDALWNLSDAIRSLQGGTDNANS